MTGTPPIAVWVDASSGASGDMLLGALVGAGVPVAVLQAAVDAVSPEPVTLRVESVTRDGFAAARCQVEVADSVTHRTWRDVRALLDRARDAGALDAAVHDLAVRTFTRLAEAEGAVHGHAPEEVHFHEVGALDSIADVVGVCAGVVHLGAPDVTVSPIAVGSGTVRTAHGTLPVPPPAVAALLVGAPSYAGPESAPATELCTPTGAALLTTLATGWGPQPPLVVSAVGVGAGGRDPDGHANVLRLLVGSPLGGAAPDSTDETDASDDLETRDLVVLEANVDDLDPRAWPVVLQALLDTGARDAWLTPILMKKGRPAHTLGVLVDPDRVETVRDAVFAQTSTIGVREHDVRRRALPRTEVGVEVDGQPIAVKLSHRHGRVVTAQPEWDDVARAAHAVGRPVRDLARDAAAAARTIGGEPPHPD